MRFIGLLGGVVFLILLTMGVFIWTQSIGDGSANFGEAQKVASPPAFLMAALMLFGIVFGATYNELQGDNVEPLTAVKRVFKRPGLYRALLAAPIVFAGVYAFAGMNSDNVVVGIFAFQNGFFCENIFRKNTAVQPQPG